MHTVFCLLAVITIGGVVSAPTYGHMVDRKDSLTVVSVQPSGPLTRGVEVELTFEIDVQLETADEAIVSLGFNTRQPRSWEMIEEYEVYRGAERITLKATVTPVDWGRRGDFAALINIGPKERKNYKPVTSVLHEFEIVP